MIKRSIVLGALIIFTLNGCNTLSKSIRPTEESKVYLGSTQIASSQPYLNFINSRRTEKDKLGYLLDRVKESRGFSYIYERDQYGWVDAYAAGTWLLWRHYKKGEDARSFLDRERDPDPSQSAYIQPSGGERTLAYDVLLNELALLEETLKTAPPIPVQEPLAFKNLHLGIPFSAELFRFSTLLLQQSISGYAHIFSILPNHTGVSNTLTTLEGFVNSLFQSFLRY